MASNPSLVLGFLLVILRPFLKFRLVSDAHYAGVRALDGTAVMQFLLDLHNRWVDLVIVTNQGHASRVSGLGTSVFVCPDPLPVIPRANEPEIVPAGRSVLLICSFDKDEPFEAVFEAFRQLESEGYRLYVTGRFERAGVRPEAYPWVEFLGFVSDETYYAYLRACDVIMDLTTSEDCLVCGAYEAIAVEKPLVLSATKAQQDYFADSAIYCSVDDLSIVAIAASVREAYDRRGRLPDNVRQWKARNAEAMTLTLRSLEELLD